MGRWWVRGGGQWGDGIVGDGVLTGCNGNGVMGRWVWGCDGCGVMGDMNGVEMGMGSWVGEQWDIERGL